MNKRVTNALREKANELSTIKQPKMKAKTRIFKVWKNATHTKEEIINRITISYAPGTTQQVFNKLKTWYLNLPGNERSINRINNLKEIPC